ncbi:hypothetical protein J2T12_001922 [Paenibacillus anaericanus]|nr:hypothetical protein [Paenibacillus anaericanus]
MNSVLIIGFLFSLVAIFRNDEEEYLKSFLKSISVFSILLCVLKINESASHLTVVNFLIGVSVVSFLIYQFLETDIRWK